MRIDGKAFRTIWPGEDTSSVVVIDQTKLPREVVYVTCKNYEEVAVAIVDMIIRGAPAIGVAAAMGVAIGAQQADAAKKISAGEKSAADLAAAQARIRTLESDAAKLAADDSLRITVNSYASASAEPSDERESKARRMSLIRAINLRQYLFSKGVKATRIDIRALGSKTADVDRIDVVQAAAIQ